MVIGTAIQNHESGNSSLTKVVSPNYVKSGLLSHFWYLVLYLYICAVLATTMLMYLHVTAQNGLN